MKIYSPEHSHSNSPFSELPPTVQQELSGLVKDKNIDLDSFLKEEKASDYDDILEIVLHALPHELIEKKNAEYSSRDLSLYDALTDALDTAHKRSKMWRYEGKDEYENETLTTIQVFDGAKYQQDLFEGRGNAAYVFQVPEVPGVCIKFLHTPSMQRYTPEREFALLGSVNKLSEEFTALKVPQAHGVAINADASKSFFTMETIDGMTLLQVLESPGERKKLLERMEITEDELISLLENKAVQKELADDLDRIHHSGIIHGDIHPRNIMLSKDKKFYLIDFGNAMLTTDLVEDYEITENRKELDRKTFINCFTSTAKLLKDQQAKN